MKKVYLSLPLILLFSSCDFNISFYRGSTEYVSYTSSSSSYVSIGQNITLDEDDYDHKAIIDFSNKSTVNGYIFLSDEDFLQSYKDENNCVEFVSFKNCTTGIGGLLFGDYLDSNNGEIVFNVLNGFEFLAVKVKAHPRFNEVYDFSTGDLSLRIDETYVSVNDSDYIKIEDNFEFDYQVIDTEANFVFKSPQDRLSISCYKQQCVLDSITLYY